MVQALINLNENTNRVLNIIKAKYDYLQDKLEVRANSPNNESANLELVGYGPMKWRNKKGYWM